MWVVFVFRGLVRSGGFEGRFRVGVSGVREFMRFGEGFIF